MKDETVVIPPYPGLWRKTKAYGMYSTNSLDPQPVMNRELYICSCIFLLRYQEVHTGNSPSWDSLFSRVSFSRQGYSPRLRWRQDLSKLDYGAYAILEHVIVEEKSLKLLSPKDNAIAKRRHGRRLLVWALTQFHSLLTAESFWSIILQDSQRAPTHPRAHRR